jgi:hypothetical protein
MNLVRRRQGIFFAYAKKNCKTHFYQYFTCVKKIRISMFDSKNRHLERKLNVQVQKTDKLFFLNDLKKSLDMSCAKRVKIFG